MKQLIFFVVYLLLMIGIPVGVYHYPVKDPFAEQMSAFDLLSDGENTIDPSMNGSDQDVDSISPYLSIDRHWQDSVNRVNDSIRFADSAARADSRVIYQELVSGLCYNDGMMSCLKMINVVTAICFCFVISILAAFIISLIKLINPSLRIGWFIAGMCIFNIIYLFGTIVVTFMTVGAYAWYLLLPLFSGATSVHIIVIAVAAIYLATIIFAAIGVGRAKSAAPVK